MQRLDGLNVPQRVVLVIAVGLAVRVVAFSIVVDSSGGGWFAFGPNSGVLAAPTPHRYSSGVTAVILLLAIALWSLVSLRLLARPTGPPATDE